MSRRPRAIAAWRADRPNGALFFVGVVVAAFTILISVIALGTSRASQQVTPASQQAHVAARALVSAKAAAVASAENVRHADHVWHLAHLRHLAHLAYFRRLVAHKAGDARVTSSTALTRPETRARVAAGEAPRVPAGARRARLVIHQPAIRPRTSDGHLLTALLLSSLTLVLGIQIGRLRPTRRGAARSAGGGARGRPLVRSAARFVRWAVIGGVAAIAVVSALGSSGHIRASVAHERLALVDNCTSVGNTTSVDPVTGAISVVQAPANCSPTSSISSVTQNGSTTDLNLSNLNTQTTTTPVFNPGTVFGSSFDNSVVSAFTSGSQNATASTTVTTPSNIQQPQTLLCQAGTHDDGNGNCVADTPAVTAPSVGTQVTPTATQVNTSFTCWNGNTVAAASDCPTQQDSTTTNSATTQSQNTTGQQAQSTQNTIQGQSATTTVTCPAGQHDDGTGTCVSDTQVTPRTAPITCAANSTASDCPGGQKGQNGKVPVTCAPGDQICQQSQPSNACQLSAEELLQQILNEQAAHESAFQQLYLQALAEQAVIKSAMATQQFSSQNGFNAQSLSDLVKNGTLSPADLAAAYAQAAQQLAEESGGGGQGPSTTCDQGQQNLPATTGSDKNYSSSNPDPNKPDSGSPDNPDASDQQAQGSGGSTLPPLRQAYIAEVEGLKTLADEMAANGASEEEIARAVSAERRAIGIKYKDLTPEPLRSEIYARNQKIYGDPLGPSVDWLRARGKSWQDIIEGASRTGGRDLGLGKQ